jgi:hypothetical protein
MTRSFAPNFLLKILKLMPMGAHAVCPYNVMKLLKIIGTMLLGAVAASCLFYVADLLLVGVNVYHRGELLMDALFKPSDSLSLGYLLAFCIFGIGAALGLIVGVVRAMKHK